jgi:putative transposase
LPVQSSVPGTAEERFQGQKIESFFGSMKTELDINQPYARRADAKRDLFAYIEAYYNRARLHSTLGYITPEQAELQRA